MNRQSDDPVSAARRGGGPLMGRPGIVPSTSPFSSIPSPVGEPSAGQ